MAAGVWSGRIAGVDTGSAEIAVRPEQKLWLDRLFCWRSGGGIGRMAKLVVLPLWCEWD